MLDALVSEMKAKAASAAPIGTTMKFDFTDSCLYIDGTGDINQVSTENKAAACTIKIKKEDLIDIAKGDLNPMTAFMSGKIKIDGDMSVAMKLQSLLG